MSLIAERPSMQISEMEPTLFTTEPETTPVALLAAIWPHNALKVFVSRDVPPISYDEAGNEIDAETDEVFHVYTGESDLLLPVAVIDWNKERVADRDDLHLVIERGDIYLPRHNRRAPYYLYGKMYDALDQFEVTEYRGIHAVVSRK